MNSCMYIRWFCMSFLMVGLTIAGCASPKKLMDVEQEVNRLKVTVEVLEKSNVEMNMKLDTLKDTIEKLDAAVRKNNERLESLLTQVSMSEKSRTEREKASDYIYDRLYVPDVDTETPAAKPSHDTSSVTSSSTPSMEDFFKMDPHTLYNNAFTHYKEGLYGKAILEFEEFVSRFPEHNLADNAQYWIGEVYYSQKDYNRALHEFQKVLDLYPLGNKVPDAMLKIAFSFKELREYRKALDQFQKVIERFPDSDAAIKAREQMEIIRSEQ